MGLMTGTTDLSTHPLAAVRLRQGWTLTDVAALVQRRSGLNMACRREKVWRWERGVTPELPAQYALADELDVSHAQVDAHPWPGWLLLVDPAEPVDGLWTPQVARDVLAQVVESALMDRLRRLCNQTVLAELFGVDRSVITKAVRDVRPLLHQHGHTVAPSTARFPTPADLMAYLADASQPTEIKPAC